MEAEGHAAAGWLAQFEVDGLRLPAGCDCIFIDIEKGIRHRELFPALLNIVIGCIHIGIYAVNLNDVPAVPRINEGIAVGCIPCHRHAWDIQRPHRPHEGFGISFTPGDMRDEHAVTRPGIFCPLVILRVVDDVLINETFFFKIRLPGKLHLPFRQLCFHGVAGVLVIIRLHDIGEIEFRAHTCAVCRIGVFPADLHQLRAGVIQKQHHIAEFVRLQRRFKLCRRFKGHRRFIQVAENGQARFIQLRQEEAFFQGGNQRLRPVIRRMSIRRMRCCLRGRRHHRRRCLFCLRL